MEILSIPGVYDIKCLPLSVDDFKTTRTGESYLRLRLQVIGGEYDGHIHFHMVFPNSERQDNSARALEQLKTLGWDGSDYFDGTFPGLGDTLCVGTFEPGKPYNNKPTLNCRYIDDKANPRLRGRAMWQANMKAF